MKGFSMSFIGSKFAAAMSVALVGAIAACASIGAPAQAPVIAQEVKVIVNSDPVVIVSKNSFADTVAKLKAAIEASPAKLVALVDHAAGAASVNLPLEPSTLFIFGNPAIGTPVMQANPLAGLDLPLKMLVYVDGGQVKVAYVSGEQLAARYKLEKLSIERIDAALGRFSAAATQ